MNIRWLGHASFLVQTRGKAVLFDPWFQKEGNRLVPPAASVMSLPKIDVIAITHEHFDHWNAGEVEAIAGRNFSHVLAPSNVTSQLNLPARLKVPVRSGESFNLEGLDFTVTQASHPQSTNPVGYTLSDEKVTVYHAGDTYDFAGLSLLRPDVALLPIGGTYTMDVLSAVTAVKKMYAKYVIPMHFNTFSNIRADHEDFAKRVKAHSKASPIKLAPGEAIEV